MLQIILEMDQLTEFRFPFKASMQIFESPSMITCLKSFSVANWTA